MDQGYTRLSTGWVIRGSNPDIDKIIISSPKRPD